MEDIRQGKESIVEVIEHVGAKSLYLPEFQRDFTWDMQRTFDLLDSIARGIFIGALIYGQPEFELTCRELDTRPRQGQGSRRPLELVSFTAEQIVGLVRSQQLRVLLDGQQRVTSLYRALTDADPVYFRARHDLNPTDVPSSVEEWLERFDSSPAEDALSVRLHDAHRFRQSNLMEDELRSAFDALPFVRAQSPRWTPADQHVWWRAYVVLVRKLVELLCDKSLVVYYLLDMGIDKFCLFFERSNSRAIPLSFIDILRAKLYQGFNLRSHSDSFRQEHPQIEFDEEVVVRYIAYRKTQPPSVRKDDVLRQLGQQHFNELWGEGTGLYRTAIAYLEGRHFLLSQRWMPYQNMLLPLMVFLQEIGGQFSAMAPGQARFLQSWYWGSVFSQRYSSGSSDIMVGDCKALAACAQGRPIDDRLFFASFGCQVRSPEDLLSYDKRGNAIYRGTLNLVNYAAGGLPAWTNGEPIGFNLESLEDHHIFPREYLKRTAGDLDSRLWDCVPNRTLIPRTLNKQVGAKPPSAYLADLSARNPALADALERHRIPNAGRLIDGRLDSGYDQFIRARAEALFDLVQQHAGSPPEDPAT